MILALKIFTWITLLTGVLYDVAQIASLFSPLGLGTPYLFYLASFIQAILLYVVTKEKRLLYWYGAYTLCVICVTLSIYGLPFLNFLNPNSFFIAFCPIALILMIFSCLFIYKLYFLLYHLTQQKVFRYALFVAIFGTIGSTLTGVLEIYTLISQKDVEFKSLWLASNILDCLNIVLFSIGVLRSKFEKRLEE